MTLSDHEQTVLRHMELTLRADNTRCSTTHPRARQRSLRHLAAAIALVTAGIVSIAAGLALADDVGTGLGVVGFVLIVVSCSYATHVLAPLCTRRTDRDSKPVVRPG